MGYSVRAIGSANQSTYTTSRAATFYLILAAVGFVFGGISTTCLEIAAEGQTQCLRSEYFRAILRQEIGYWDEKDIGTLAPAIEESCILVSFKETVLRHIS
eukprot:Blabericola_migrator_1__1109@NODE_1283_length_4904_cov_126_132934_g867_i0_p4_GENE_NODE_1283_length_4904_cov_126_132934_g867_i0NODE_1283_length_4904_cov_126_132934_g867_i0_p4_ORF_typecomplete_len101_score19_89ABC_membrane/PF00664_23/1_1e12_NODE_1283_length_4904_cov_126_132934_g867_i022012503